MDPFKLHVYKPYKTFPDVLVGSSIEKTLPNKKTLAVAYESEETHMESQ